MRTTFVKTLMGLMEADPKIVTLTADMGFGVFEELQATFPNRFVNTGVAEANTVGIAAGLALSGYRPFFYAQAPFATLRCFEQMRLDIASNNLDVKIVGTSSGFTLGQYGASHCVFEDVGAMRLLPNMTIVCPGDVYEAEMATREAATMTTPLYIRIGRSNSFGSDQLIHTNKPPFQIGKGILISEGAGIALVATGSMLLTASRVAEKLREAGVSVALVSMHTIKPVDTEMLQKLSREIKTIITLEEHSEIGGLGSAVLEQMHTINPAVRVVRIGTKEKFLHVTGSREYLLGQHGLTADQVCETIMTIAR